MDAAQYLGAIAAVQVSRRMTFIPPAAVAREAERGLAYRKKFGRGGTPVGVARAVQLKNRRPVSLDTIARMYSYFSRHAVDKRPGWDDPKNPSTGYIAWLLWGGDPGRLWATAIWKRFSQKLGEMELDEAGMAFLSKSFTLTDKDLRRARDMILANIKKHCTELYRRGSMSLDACKAAAIIAAAEVADVFKEEFGIDVGAPVK